MLRRALALLIILGTAGCGPAMNFAGESLGLPVASKRVAMKNPPQELVATDGTTCIVNEDRFDRTEIGDLVACAWSDPSRPALPVTRE